MNGIVIPTDDQVREKAFQIWSERGGGNGFDQYDWFAAQDLLGIDLNYTCIAKHKLVDTNKNWFGTIENRICRFCFRRAPAVTFRNEAHAVPEFLGNKALFSRDECDECNAHFAGTVETAFGDMTLLYRANAQLFGKGNKKTFETNSRDARVDADRSTVHVKQTHDSNFMSIDPSAKKYRIKEESKEIVPLRVFKCLAKMALSVMPDTLLRHCLSTASWVRSDDPTVRPAGTEQLGAYLTVVPGGQQDYHGAAFLFVRSRTLANLPAVLFLITFRHLAFQVALPLCALDNGLTGKLVVFPIPHWYKFDPAIGPPIRQIIDLSSGKPERLIQVHDGGFKGMKQHILNVGSGVHDA